MKQNVIFLIVDQQMRSCLTDSRICKTPNIDSLMKDSIRFNNAHCVNAICSPSRASMITGMLPHNHGMIDCGHTVPDRKSVV